MSDATGTAPRVVHPWIPIVLAAFGSALTAAGIVFAAGGQHSDIRRLRLDFDTAQEDLRRKETALTRDHEAFRVALQTLREQARADAEAQRSEHARAVAELRDRMTTLQVAQAENRTQLQSYIVANDRALAAAVQWISMLDGSRARPPGGMAPRNQSLPGAAAMPPHDVDVAALLPFIGPAIRAPAAPLERPGDQRDAVTPRSYSEASLGAE